MALSSIYLAIFFIIFVDLHSLAKADSFIQSSAAYYPNSEQNGTTVGACGYGSFGSTLNGGDVSAASSLYRNGVGCGACYQVGPTTVRQPIRRASAMNTLFWVKCTNTNFCSDNGVTIVITDSGASGNTDFILSERAFKQMGQTADSSASLVALGVVNIEYKRVSCNYPNKNITFKIDESSNFPNYLAFQIWFQQGNQDITAVQVCETENLTCKLLSRSHGAVWAVVSPPSGTSSIRMLLSGHDDVMNSDDQSSLVSVNNIPENWNAGDTYDSGVQLN